jgi:hypothetical protein
MLCLLTTFCVTPALPQSSREATIEPDTKARLVLQTQLNSKLNEVGDPVTATLDEPLYVNNEMVLQRGTEFSGRVTEVTPAGKGQKNGKIGIIFEKVRMPWGEEPVSMAITAIDDWNSNEKMKANEEGKVSGNRSGDRTMRNVERGGSIGALGGLATVLLGGGGAVAGAAIGGGLLGGLLMTKGGDVRVAPGAVFRVKFVKPLTLPVVQQNRPAGSTSHEANTDSQAPVKNP